MLIQQLQQLENLLEQQQEERDSRAIVQLLEKRNQELTALASDWKQIVDLAIEMQMKFIDTEKLIKTRDLCKSDVWISTLTNDKREVDLYRTMKGSARSQRESLKIWWRTLQDQRPTQVALTRAHFLVIVGSTDVKTQLARLNQNIQRIVDYGELPTLQQFQQWSTWIDEMEQFVVTHLPYMTPQIETFFNKLTQGGATIDDLTDEVVSWCRANHLTHRITLKFSDGG